MIYIPDNLDLNNCSILILSPCKHICDNNCSPEARKYKDSVFRAKWGVSLTDISRLHSEENSKYWNFHAEGETIDEAFEKVIKGYKEEGERHRVKFQVAPSTFFKRKV